MMALLLVCSLTVTAFAAEYDLALGSVIVNATESGQTVTHGSNAAVPDSAPVITQSNSSTPTSNTVTITAAADTTANVTLSGVNIDTGTSGGAAVEIKGNGDVVIELDGSNTVQSGQKHAGVEKNTIAPTDTDSGTGNGNLTVTDENGTQGSLEATGGFHGAGIGGGEFGSGSNITITGSAEVTANGGFEAAGIGGGFYSSGSNIEISGSAEVTAQGNDGGAGIGGGYNGIGSDITISKDAQVKAQGGNRFHPDNHRYYYSAGAAIGNGGKGQEDSYPTPGSEVPPNTNDLDEGWIATYAPGTEKMDTTVPNSLTYKDASGTVQTGTEGIQIEEAQSATCTEDGHQDGFSVDGAVVAVTIPKTGHSFTNYIPDNNATCTEDGTKTAKCDHCDATDTIPDPGSRLVFLPGEYYKVIGKDGKTPPCKETNQNGVLTITADADFASLTGALSGMQALKAHGIDTIVFVTNGATSTFAIADLLAQGGDGYTLTHDGETVTFTLGNGADISEILK